MEGAPGGSGDADLPPAMAWMIDRLLQVVKAQQAQIQTLLREGRGASSPSTPEIRVQTVETAPQAQATMVVNFLKLKPPTFNGTEDYLGLNTWIVELEKLFKVSGNTDEQKLVLALFLLKEDAYTWWEQEQLSIRQRTITWVEFKDRLMAKFLPLAEKDRLHDKFVHLLQEGRSVREYEREFTRLSRFAPGMVSTELDRIVMFEKGLKFSLRGLVSAYRSTTFGDSFQAALKVELENEERQELLGRKDKKRASTIEAVEVGKKQRQEVTPEKGKGKEGDQEEWKKKIGFDISAVKKMVVCHHCGKEDHLKKDCCLLRVRCFGCQNMGHYANQCPNKAESSQKGKTGDGGQE